MATILESKQTREFLTQRYREALGQVLPDGLSLSEDEAGRAAEWAAIDTVGKHLWTVALGDLWDWRRAAERLHVTSRQAIQARAHRGTLLGLAQDGRLVFPSWQFTPTGGLYPIVKRVLRIFRDLGLSDPRLVVSWFSTEQDELEGQRPVDWMRGDRPPEPLLLAARRAAFAFMA
ncbi:MAG TPA: hypothetical protein VGK54_18090 [Chloroflexota bacterium]